MLKTKSVIREEEVKEALYMCAEQVKKALPQFTYSFPGTASEKLFYKPNDENIEWTTGFWTGELWLAYELLQEETLKEAAFVQVDSFYERIDKEIYVDNHDMGFLYSLSCVAAYKLTGLKKAKKAAIMAADKLISRFQPNGEFIQAWGALDDPEQYRLIIDCLLNLPLLYWASDVTGEKKYEKVASLHFQTTMNCIFRDDYSSYHTYYFNPSTGKPMYGTSHQGYRNESTWARGQAWGVYGTALAYRYMKKEEYVEIFDKVIDYYIHHLSEELVPYWDLEFTKESDEPKDSSAAAIVACGLLEMATLTQGEKSVEYKNLAKKIMKSLYEHYAVKSPEESNGLLKHGTYSKSSPYNTCQNNGVDECTLFGDYFYMEALMRLYKDWPSYW